MKKEYVIPAIVVILILVFGLMKYYPDKDDIKIVKIEGPKFLGLHETGELVVTIRNSALSPVNVSIDVENAFILKNGTSIRYIFDPANPDNVITLRPGNNTYKHFLGYLVTGTHNVKVKVYQKGILVDQSSFNVTVSVPQIPDLSVQLSYIKETKDGNDVYNIYGYLIENSLLTMNHYEVPVQITIMDDLTGQTILNNTEIYTLYQQRITTLSRWENRPVAIIEVANNRPSEETYLPVEYVVKGKYGDRYRVNVTVSWEDPWYEQRYVKWLEQEGRVYETNGYWWDKHGMHYEPPKFDRIISGSDELLIPPD